MDVPMSWLNDYVEIDAKIKDFVEDMTLSGSKVEGYTEIGGLIKNVVTGKIEKIENHPNADKLVVCTVDIGTKKLSIVTGATNLKEGDYVPVALDDSVLADGTEIHAGDFRGVMSEGMLCSIQELGCDLHDFPNACVHGIYVFDEPVELGVDATEALDLRDTVVEFEITSNRPDCFSIIGLAREAAVTYNKPLHYPEIKVEEKAEGKASDWISVQIASPDLCPRYIARIVKNVKIEPSPRWMRKRLRAAGMRPINNIVDITNYVMLELGQPMHAFDIDDISERKIIVRNAKEGEEITTLDGNVRKLEPSMLLITDPEKAIGIAGIMGGENSKVSPNASAILFESANFNGPNIRVSAKKLGLRTDASGKYEKGLDPNLALDAVNRAVQLVALLGAGEVVPEMVDCYPNPRKPWEVSYDPDWINGLLGTKIDEAFMIDVFERLEMKVDKATRKVTVPTFRPDIEAMADLSEEVACFYGYDKIEATLAAGTSTVGKKTYGQTITSMIKEAMISSGLSESMVYSFESPKVFEKLGIPNDDPLRKTVTIYNPLGEDFSIMRTTTLNGMLNSLATNYNRRNEKARLFEIGKIYIPKALPVTELPYEPSVLTIGMYGNTDFYDIKGIAEYLFNILGIGKKAQFAAVNNLYSWMHPGRTANILVDGSEIGYVGELHPRIAANYDIGTKVYIAVLSVEGLIDNAQLVNIYKPLPKFPAITRDISMLVADNVTVKEIEDIIYANGGEDLEEVTLFDVYQGTQIEAGYKSVAYSLTFRGAERTLVDQEANVVMEKILSELKTKLSAQLRDK